MRLDALEFGMMGVHQNPKDIGVIQRDLGCSMHRLPQIEEADRI